MTKPFLPPAAQRFIFTGLGILLTILALLTPYWEVAEPASYVGGLLVWAAFLEILHGFKRAENHARLSVWFSGGITLLIGVLMINAILFQRDALIRIILIHYNQAPYFQSFMEIKVERSKSRIKLIPYGIHGQLKWRDFEYGGLGKPASSGNDDYAEWVFPM